MEEYLEDLQLRPMLHRITEKALVHRPANVIALAMDVVCGTDDHLKDEEEEDEPPPMSPHVVPNAE